MQGLPIKRVLTEIGALLIFLVALTFASGSAYALRLWHDFEIPSKAELLAATNTGLTLTDRHGEEFFTFDVPGRKTIVPLTDISPTVIHALTAAEDKTFFNHLGIAPSGIIRAAYLDYQTKSWQHGGSTITQQLAKIALRDSRKTLLRKFREAVFAVKLEQTFSKNDILETYLNSAYFGAGAYGIEEAAHTYFGKSAATLTSAESAYLVALLPAPAALSPFSGVTTQTAERHQYVLQRMHEEQHLSESQYRQAQAASLTLQDAPPPIHTTAPHFALWVREQLLEQFNHEYIVGSGLVVTTSLDLSLQRHLETLAQQHLRTLQSSGASNAAVVAIDPTTGELRSMVGSIGWNAPQFGKMNMALQPRQTGSAFKPIVYAAGLEQRTITLASILNDTPKTYQNDWRPQNYDRRYRGRVTARFALAHSLNIPAVDAISKISPRSVATLAQRLGISTLSPDAPHNLSLALGTEGIAPLELTSAYAALANGGQYTPPVSILAIRDKHGAPVAFPRPRTQRVLTEDTAFLITSVLSDNDGRRSTFGNTLELDRPAAAKTGTTQDFRDAWTVGYTPDLAVGVWIGNNDNSPMWALPGARGAAPLWRSSMAYALANTAPTPFAQPPTVASASICPRYGLLASSPAAGVQEFFLAGTEPKRRCPALLPSPAPPAEVPPDDTTITRAAPSGLPEL